MKMRIIPTNRNTPISILLGLGLAISILVSACQKSVLLTPTSTVEQATLETTSLPQSIQATAPLTPVLLPTITNTNSPTNTLAPTETTAPTGTFSPPNTITPTPEPRIAVVNSNAIAYAGPGEEFPIVAKFPKGFMLIILGRNIEGTWLLAQVSLDQRAWVLLSTLTVDFKIDPVPQVVEITPPAITSTPVAHVMVWTKLSFSGKKNPTFEIMVVNLKPLEYIEISVYRPGSTTNPGIYKARASATGIVSLSLRLSRYRFGGKYKVVVNGDQGSHWEGYFTLKE